MKKQLIAFLLFAMPVSVLANTSVAFMRPVDSPGFNRTANVARGAVTVTPTATVARSASTVNISDAARRANTVSFSQGRLPVQGAGPDMANFVTRDDMMRFESEIQEQIDDVVARIVDSVSDTMVDTVIEQATIGIKDDLAQIIADAVSATDIGERVDEIENTMATIEYVNTVISAALGSISDSLAQIIRN